MKLLRLLLYLSIPIQFLYPHAIFEGIYLNYLYIIFCFFLLLLFGKRLNYNYRSIKIFGLLFVGDFFACLISLFFNNIDITRFFSGICIELCSFLLTIIICNTDCLLETFPKFTKVIFYSCLIISLSILLDGIISPLWFYKLFYPSYENNEMLLNALDNSAFHRACGTLLSPIMSGTFSVALILYWFSCIINRNHAFYNYLLGLLGIFGLLLSTSRTSILALFISLIYYCIYINRFSLKLIIKLLILFIVLYITLKYSHIVYFDHVYNNLLTRNEELNNGLFVGSGRADTLIHALNNKLDIRCFLFGIGDGEYNIIDEGYSYAHNGFISILIPKGIFGICCYCVLFFQYMKQSMLMMRIPSIKSYCLFLNLFLFFSLITFFSADFPMSMHWVFMLSIVLSYFDCLNKRYNHEVVYFHRRSFH